MLYPVYTFYKYFVSTFDCPGRIRRHAWIISLLGWIHVWNITNHQIGFWHFCGIEMDSDLLVMVSVESTPEYTVFQPMVLSLPILTPSLYLRLCNITSHRFVALTCRRIHDIQPHIVDVVRGSCSGTQYRDFISTIYKRSRSCQGYHFRRI